MNTTTPNQTRHRGSVLYGCLAALVVFIILAIIAGVFVAKSWRGIVASGLKQSITVVLDETQIEQTEKDEINAHISTLMNKFENKEISTEDLGKITVEIFEGPLLSTGIVAASFGEYFAKSELDDETKADAKIQLARIANGIYTEAIDIDELENILAPLCVHDATTSGPDTQTDGGTTIKVQTNTTTWSLKPTHETTTEELIELIANARAAADLAEIDESPPTIDLSDEVAIAIAAVLGEDPSLWIEEVEEETEP